MTDRPGRAALWMMGAVTAFSLMAVAGRQVAGVHDSFEVLTFRSAVGFAVVVAIATLTGRRDQISRASLGGHAIRNSVHFLGQNLWFWALTQVTLAQLFAIEFTAPIWVILLAPLVLGERLTALRLAAALLGFIGILIVARPDPTALNWGLLAAAGAAVSFAAVSILTKRLTRGTPVLGILFWLTAMQFVMGLVCAGADGQITWPSVATAPWLVVIGLCGVFAHLSLTTALTLAPAGFVTTVDFLRLPLIAVVGAVLYGEPLDPLVFLGGAVIFAGIALNLRSTRVSP